MSSWLHPSIGGPASAIIASIEPTFWGNFESKVPGIQIDASS
jgi:hypothetical protein